MHEAHAWRWPVYVHSLQFGMLYNGWRCMGQARRGSLHSFGLGMCMHTCVFGYMALRRCAALRNCAFCDFCEPNVGRIVRSAAMGRSGRPCMHGTWLTIV